MLTVTGKGIVIRDKRLSVRILPDKRPSSASTILDPKIGPERYACGDAGTVTNDGVEGNCDAEFGEGDSSSSLK
jgi:hypothetical protein